MFGISRRKCARQSGRRAIRTLSFEQLDARRVMAGDVVPIPVEVVEATLQEAVDNSGLEQLADNGFYIPDDDLIGYESGFDCDDYAVAMGNFLENTLPWENVEVVYGTLTPEEGDGHAVVIVEMSDVFFGIDPQTGTVLDPVESLADLDTALTEMMVTEYPHVVSPGTEFELEVSESDFFAGAPFYIDPSLNATFEYELEIALEQIDDAYCSVFTEYVQNYSPEEGDGDFVIPPTE